MKSPCILVINAGSSSHKLSLYDMSSSPLLEPLWKGDIQWGREDIAPQISFQKQSESPYYESLDSFDKKEGLWRLVNSIWRGPTQVLEGPEEIHCIGHRVVHGGIYFTEPTVITPDVIQYIKKLIPLAPLHNPANLEGIEIMKSHFPNILQVAVFDTAFHSTIPIESRTYPLPLHFKELGIQKYGFHGISHHYCAERIPLLVGHPSRNLHIVNCHLGNGCSLCAINDGISYETTMGFTPLDGLMMGTRAGSIDPGILLYLMREQHYSTDEIYRILNEESGLKAITGVSDMREILYRTDDLSILAVNMFIYRLKMFIGAMAAVLGRIDVLNFTGGIGENAHLIRGKVCQDLAYFGIDVDSNLNRECIPDQEISSATSKVRVLVIKTQEERMIAKCCSAACSYNLNPTWANA